MANKILFITQSLPPRPGAAGRRLRLLAERAKVEYAKVYAVRLDRNYGGKEIPGISVRALPGLDLRSWLGGANPGRTVDRATESQLMAVLRGMRQSFPLLLLTDDGGYLYRRSAFQICRKLVEKENVETIFSSFRPWSDHLVARKLKKRYPHLRWIADFRDLPVDPVHENVWWPALQRWWTKRVIKLADEVWTVSEGQQHQIKKWHSNIKVRRSVIAKLPPRPTAPKSGKFTIVYTGSLYQDLRTPEKLIQGLRRLLDEGKVNPDLVRLVYRGKDWAYFRHFTEGLPSRMLDIQSSIPNHEVLQLQANAQVLLLLTWSAPGYYGVLTAKLWEYLATGRPILALVKGPGDKELKGIVEGADAGAVFSEEEQEALEEWILRAYQEWVMTGTLRWTVKSKVLEEYRSTSFFGGNQ